MQPAVFHVFLLAGCGLGLCLSLLLLEQWINPRRPSCVKQTPYESGVDPIHDARRNVDVRFYLLAIAFLVFDVELLFLYPWAVATRPATTDRVTADSMRGAHSTPGDTPVNAKGVSTTAMWQRHGQEIDGAPFTLVDQPAVALRAEDSFVGIDAAVAAGVIKNRVLAFGGAMCFLGLLALGLIYDWRKGVFQWR